MRTLLKFYEKDLKYYFAESSAGISNVIHEGSKQIHDSTKLHSTFVIKRNSFANLDHENGLHPLDAIQRRFPFYVLIKAASQIISEITKKSGDGQHDDKTKASSEGAILSDMITFINTGFFFNEDMSMRFVRAQLLYKRAKRRMEMLDLKNASADCSEALNYDAALLDCYLMMARIEKNLKNYHYVGERMGMDCRPACIIRPLS